MGSREASDPNESGSQGKGDFFDVLCGGGEQALAGNGQKASEAGVAMIMELLGIGKGTFDGFLSALVNVLPHGVSRWASVRSRASAQAWRMISRLALRFEVHEASSGQLLQIAGSLL